MVTGSVGLVLALALGGLSVDEFALTGWFTCGIGVRGWLCNRRLRQAPQSLSKVGRGHKG